MRAAYWRVEELFNRGNTPPTHKNGESEGFDTFFNLNGHWIWQMDLCSVIFVSEATELCLPQC